METELARLVKEHGLAKVLQVLLQICFTMADPRLNKGDDKISHTAWRQAALKLRLAAHQAVRNGV